MPTLRWKFCRVRMSGKKPYILLFLAGLAMLAYAFAATFYGSVVVNVYDTYYVISETHLHKIYSVFLLVLGLIYWLMERGKFKLNIVISLIHSYGTIILYGFLLYFNYYNLAERTPEDYRAVFDHPDYNFYIICVLLIIILLQLLFIINIFASVAKKLANR